jgi:hypothetical protein
LWKNERILDEIITEFFVKMPNIKLNDKNSEWTAEEWGHGNWVEWVGMNNIILGQ